MRALIIVDVQNDFCEGGSLAVAGGVDVARAISAHLSGGADDVPVVGGAADYRHVVATRDYHVERGPHFSSDPDYVDSWPPHCVAGTSGASFHPELDFTRIEAVCSKGAHAAAYSGVEGADARGTPLADWLGEHGVTEVDIAGIATDHCVRATAGDAARAGLSTRVLLGLTAGVAPETTEKALDEMRAAGAELIGAPVVRG